MAPRAFSPEGLPRPCWFFDSMFVAVKFMCGDSKPAPKDCVIAKASEGLQGLLLGLAF